MTGPELTEALKKAKKLLGIMAELSGQTDRGAAIVGATIVQEELKSLILSNLLTNSKVKGMFEPDGALGAFSSQIKLAYAMRLIDHELYVDLDRIREIRNKFAHFVHYAEKKGHEAEALVTFGHKTIKQWALQLRCPAVIGLDKKHTERGKELERIFPAFKHELPALQTNPRQRFEFTCNWLQMVLRIAHQEKTIATPVGYQIKKRT